MVTAFLELEQLMRVSTCQGIFQTQLTYVKQTALSILRGTARRTQAGQKFA